METRVLNLLYTLGLTLTDYEHIWSDELRREFEEVTKHLSDGK
jgi:hypothetical protein